MRSHDLDVQTLQKRFGELRSAAHSLKGDERWWRIIDLLYDYDWPHDYLVEVVVPYLEEMLRDDTSARQAPAHWYDLDGEQLTVSPAFVLARSCTLAELTAKRLAVFSSSPHLEKLTSLDISYNKIGASGAAALASSPHLAQLTSLNLWGNEIGDEGTKALANSTTLKNLTSLNLDWNEISDEGAKAIVSSTHLTQLSNLDLAGNWLSDEQTAALANLPYLAEHLRAKWRR
jgi:Leucine-rich repeat (LRR) protein